MMNVKKLFFYSVAAILLSVSVAFAQQESDAAASVLTVLPASDGIFLFMDRQPPADAAGFFVFRAQLPSLAEITARMEQVGATAAAETAAGMEEKLEAIRRHAFGDKSLEEVMTHAAELEKKTDDESRRLLAQYEAELDEYSRLLEQAEAGMDEDLAQNNDTAKKAMLDTYHDMAGAGPDTVYTKLTDTPVAPLKSVREAESAGIKNLNAILGELGVESLEALLAEYKEDPARFEGGLQASPELNKLLGRMYVDDTAEQDGRYAYKIVFVDASGGELLSTGPVETAATFSRPAPPRALTVSQQGNAVRLAWEQPEPAAGVIGWQVFRADDLSGEFKQVSPLLRPVSGNPQWTDKTAPGGNDCAWKVMAVTRTGPVGAASNVAGAAVPAVSTLPRPTGVIAAPDNDAVLVDWKAANAGSATGVNVYRGASVTGDAERLTRTPALVADGRFRDDTAQPGTMYYYSIAFVDAQGIESERSTARPVRIEDKQPPAKPAGLAVEHDDTGAVQLAWQPGEEPDIRGYDVYRKSDTGDFSKITLQLVAADTPAFSDTEHLESGTYHYAVSAVDISMNESALSDSVELIIPDTEPPAAPQSITIVSGNGIAAVSWPPALGRDTAGYRLYRAQNESGPYEGIADIPADTGRTYEDEDVESGKTYYYQLATVDESGNESAPCAPAAVVVRDTAPPAAPRDVTAQATESGIEIKWRTSGETDIAGFRLMRCETETGAYDVVENTDTLTAEETRFMDEDAAPGKQYWYRIQAVDTSGNRGPRSEPAGPVSRE